MSSTCDEDRAEEQLVEWWREMCFHHQQLCCLSFKTSSGLKPLWQPAVTAKADDIKTADPDDGGDDESGKVQLRPQVFTRRHTSPLGVWRERLEA